jgi:hypothetical protein
MIMYIPEVQPGHEPGIPLEKGIVEPVVTGFDDHVLIV